MDRFNSAKEIALVIKYKGATSPRVRAWRDAMLKALAKDVK